MKHRNVKVELYDKDYTDMKIMGMTYSQYDGTFALYGCGMDHDWFYVNHPDPYIFVSHSCGTDKENSYAVELPSVFVPELLELGVLILDGGMPVNENEYLMQENNNTKYAVSSDFDHLEFGKRNKIATYGRSKTVSSLIPQSPTISALISGVSKECCVKFIDADYSPLPNHIIGYNEVSQKTFIRAEIRFENLNKGADITLKKSLLEFNVYSYSGDIPFQYFPKNIGGPDCSPNVFPLNPDSNITEWKSAISTVYDHVKDGEENSARLIYVIDNVSFGRERPAQLFYNFKLYKNNEVVLRDEIEGKILNPKPSERNQQPKNDL